MPMGFKVKLEVIFSTWNMFSDCTHFKVTPLSDPTCAVQSLSKVAFGFEGGRHEPKPWQFLLTCENSSQ